jgi:hypothetical protein
MRKRLSHVNSHWLDWFRRADISGFTFIDTRRATSRNLGPPKKAALVGGGNKDQPQNRKFRNQCSRQDEPPEGAKP